MEKVFDHIKVDRLITSAGLSQAAIARELQISREAVSKWMSGENVPRPRHRTLLAALLGVSLVELGTLPGAVREPLVAFRTKKNKNIKEEQREWIKRDMMWVSRLEDRLGQQGLHASLPIHNGPATPSEASALALQFRSMLALTTNDAQTPVHAIITYLASRGVIILPVFWGGRKHQLNAMHVRFPDSVFNWLYIDLDSSMIDVRFWLLHETAHMIRRRPHDADMDEEQFAESFAAEVLFPSIHARELLNLLHGHEPEQQAAMIHRLARARTISAVTVYKQLNAVLLSDGKPVLGLDGLIFKKAASYATAVPSFTDYIFGGAVPPAQQFVERCGEQFSTPVFELAAAEIQQKQRGHGFVERIFQCGMMDAVALHEALREYGSEENSA